MQRKASATLRAAPRCRTKTESAIAATLGKIQADHPEVDIGSYPFTREGRIGTTLVVRGTSPAVLTAVVTKINAMVVAAGETPHEQE